EDEQDHQLSYEQAPEQSPAGQLGGGGVGPGAGDVVGPADEVAHGQGGAGEGDALGPGALGEQGREAGGRPHQHGHAEEEREYADQEAVGDAALAVPAVLAAV